MNPNNKPCLNKDYEPHPTLNVLQAIEWGYLTIEEIKMYIKQLDKEISHFKKEKPSSFLDQYNTMDDIERNIDKIFKYENKINEIYQLKKIKEDYLKAFYSEFTNLFPVENSSFLVQGQYFAICRGGKEVFDERGFDIYHKLEGSSIIIYYKSAK